MSWKREWRILAFIIVVFVVFFYLPVGTTRFDRAILEALHLAKWYAQEHVIFCLVPAFFIAGAISVFVRQSSVIKYLGAKANKVLAYGVASVSGTILAVCSCTVLPLFAGIYRRGAGLGPATAFLYSGPAINILAIVLTARVLGLELGIARALGAVLFSVVIGLLMRFVFRNEEETIDTTADVADTRMARPLWQDTLFFSAMVGILVFANWGRPSDPHSIWNAVYSAKWLITGALSVAFAAILVLWFNLKWWQVVMASLPAVLLTVALGDEPLIPFVAGVLGLSVITSTDKGEAGEWFESSWDLAKQILPLLFIGVLIAGFCLGRPGEQGVIPSQWVGSMVGDNSIGANFFASVVGAFMYFATLTEVPILEGLLGAGMGKGPALALLLAGPALSLPNMLVIRNVIGTRKTIVFVSLVVIMATVSGVIYGNLFE